MCVWVCVYRSRLWMNLEKNEQQFDAINMRPYGKKVEKEWARIKNKGQGGATHDNKFQTKFIRFLQNLFSQKYSQRASA